VTISKTALGLQVMKDRSVSLSSQQRSALILCDGKRTAEEVLRMTVAVGVTAQDLDALVSMNLIVVNASPSVPLGTPKVIASDLPAQAAVAQASEADQSTQAFKTALNAAITLCSDLGFKGFSLNMALSDVESLEKLQKLAPQIRRAAGDQKYRPLHALIFGQPL
jgi:hypothetical protein